MSEELTPEQFKAEIQKAEAERDFPKLSRMLNLPVEVLMGQRVLSRKERRQWYHENRKRLGLPKWGALETLKGK